MPSALRGGAQTYWRQWGDQPEMLMLHCSLGHSGAWAGVANALNRDAIAVDLPGHGKSDPHDPGVDFHAQCTSVAADFLTPSPIDLVGHSFGATVALRLAMEAPHAVRSLALIEPVFFAAARGTEAFAQHERSAQPFVEALQSGDAESAAQVFCAQWGTGVPWAQLRDHQRQAMIDQIHVIPAEDGSIYHDNAGMLLPDRLESLDCPVLFIKGAKTEPIIGAVELALRARIPTTQAATIEGAGHMVPITHPVETAGVIREFLA